MIMVKKKNMQKYFKQFQSLTMVMWLELGITDAMQNTVFENTVQRVNKCLETSGGHVKHLVTFCIVIIRCTETF
jgi:hypothetical protein